MGPPIDRRSKRDWKHQFNPFYPWCGHVSTSILDVAMHIEALSAFLKRDDLLLDPTRAKLTKEECKRLIVIALACQTEKSFCDFSYQLVKLKFSPQFAHVSRLT